MSSCTLYFYVVLRRILSFDNPSLLHPLEASFEENSKLQSELTTVKDKFIRVMSKGQSKMLNMYQAQEKNREKKVEKTKSEPKNKVLRRPSTKS